MGLATAIGGGTIRDVLLDVTPGWMTDPIYLICTGPVSYTHLDVYKRQVVDAEAYHNCTNQGESH